MSASTTRRNKSAAFIGAGIAAGIIGAWALSANGQGGAATGTGIPVTSITSTTAGPSTTSGPSQSLPGPASLPGPIGEHDGGDGHGGDR
jgi:ribose/xylose/arabinose/galactoside ABC-type transport system permease subunit